MERGLQERIVGAIVLVVLGVIAIPVLLDGPRTAQTQRMAVDLPVQPGSALRTHTIVLDQNDTAPRETGRLAVAEPAAAPAAAQVPATQDSAPANDPEPANLPAAASASVAETAANWAVQVGSFASRDNAERLAMELNGKGFPAFVSRHAASGKTLFRVRVGPEPDAEGAQALAARLGNAGQDATLVRHP